MNLLPKGQSSLPENPHFSSYYLNNFELSENFVTTTIEWLEYPLEYLRVLKVPHKQFLAVKV